MQYNVHAAKTQLAKLIEAVERGEEVIIARRNVPAVKLVPVEEKRQAEKRRPVKFGLLKGLVEPDTIDWFAPMDEEELALWEGRSKD